MMKPLNICSLIVLLLIDCGNLSRTDLNYFVNFVLNKENICLGCKDESLLLNLLIILTKKLYLQMQTQWSKAKHNWVKK